MRGLMFAGLVVLVSVGASALAGSLAVDILRADAGRVDAAHVEIKNLRDSLAALDASTAELRAATDQCRESLDRRGEMIRELSLMLEWQAELLREHEAEQRRKVRR